jgi:hypothetical protein
VGRPGRGRAPDLAAGLPGELVTGGVDDGAATVDATMSRRR